MSMHSVLIVGCGSIGERHVRCFLLTGRARVTGCDTSAPLLQRIAETYRIPTRNDAAAAIADADFDTVVICTPAHLHVPLALQALKAGKNVLIEKPLSQSLAGVNELLEVHASSGRQAAVAYVYHAYPFLIEAKAFLARREFGPVLQATAVSGQSFPTFRPAYASTYFRDRATGGGAIQDSITHIANWMEAVLGPTDSLFCDCAHLSLPGVEVEDTVHVVARHGGILVNYSLNQFQAPNETVLQFNAERGSVRVELHRQRWGTFRPGEKDWSWHERPVAERDAAFIGQAEAFLDQVEGKPPRLCSLAAAAQTLRFNLAALASSTQGVRIHCRSLQAG